MTTITAWPAPALTKQPAQRLSTSWFWGGQEYRVSSTLGQALEAWSLVYDVYHHSGLIEANRFGLHTSPAMVGPHSVVMQRRTDGLLDSTISAVLDSAAGLPLDSVYESELNQLRRPGRQLIEVGLFADARQVGGTDAKGELTRTAAMAIRKSLMELTGSIFHFGRASRVTDFVIGVHPRHARFYCQLWGFTPFGNERTYAAVNDRPVVLLWCDWRALEENLDSPSTPLAIQHCLRQPINLATFDARYRFVLDEGTSDTANLIQYLRERYPHPVSSAA